MARTDRQQRRQRRAEKLGTPPLQPARKPQQVEPVREAAPEAAPDLAVERQAEGRRGIPGLRFLQESWAELKKVEWPGQQQLISGTAVVIVACLITGAYLYLNDQVWQFVVKHLLLQ